MQACICSGACYVFIYFGKDSQGKIGLHPAHIHMYMHTKAYRTNTNTHTYRHTHARTWSAATRTGCVYICPNIRQYCCKDKDQYTRACLCACSTNTHIHTRTLPTRIEVPSGPMIIDLTSEMCLPCTLTPSTIIYTILFCMYACMYICMYVCMSEYSCMITLRDIYPHLKTHGNFNSRSEF
jgi:hypothetical protein